MIKSAVTTDSASEVVKSLLTERPTYIFIGKNPDGSLELSGHPSEVSLLDRILKAASEDTECKNPPLILHNISRAFFGAVIEAFSGEGETGEQ